jgi:phage/plasmid-like protein (TIGR03299 family)
MAHEIAKTADGRDAMAYVGDTPWHGLGQVLTADASLDTWATESGLDFKLNLSPIFYKPQEDNMTHLYKGKNVIFRQDTSEALGVVSNRYKIVQPIEVLHFFKEIVGSAAQLETAGVLRNGAHYWALAKMEGEFSLGNDKVNQYLLLASSADGSLATQARLTTVRVVCNNTMQIAQNNGQAVKVRHNSIFDPTDVMKKLGEINAGFKAFQATAESLARVKLTADKAKIFFATILGGTTEKPSRQAVRAFQLFDGEGKGSDLESSHHTAWGALNAVTQLVDWENARTDDARIRSAWFGYGATLKQQALDALVTM